MPQVPQVDFEDPPPNRHEPTILIVDDEDALRELMREALETEGYFVVDARSGLDAMEAMEHVAIDLLIADHGLPGLQGSQLVDAATKAHPDLRVLYISGYDQDVGRDGGHAFLAKPFTPGALAAMVEGLLGGRASAAAP